MARPGITYLQVAQVATELKAKHTNPTIESIRHKLGTGSNSTIAGHLKRWRQEHEPDVFQDRRTSLPPEWLVKMETLWEELKQQANHDIEKIKSEHAKQIEKLELENKNLAHESQALQQKLENANKDIINRDQALAQWNQKCENQAKCIDHQALENKSMSGTIVDKEAIIKDIHRQLTHAQNNLEHFREAAKQQRENDLLQHQEVISELNGKLSKLNNQLNDVSEIRLVLSTDLEKYKARCEHLTVSLAQAEEQLSAKQEKTIALISDNKVLTRENENITTALKSLQTEKKRDDEEKIELRLANERLTGELRTLKAIKQIEEEFTD